VDLNKEIKYKKASIDYNSNVPNYRAIYKLNSKDKIFQKLKSRYPIPFRTAIMTIKGEGKGNNEEIGDKEINIRFKNDKCNYYDTFLFMPTKENKGK